MRLRKQADRCNFGKKLEDHVKDQLIEKCSSSILRRKLLTLGDVKLDVILREAKAFEAAQEQGNVMGNDTVSQEKASDINKIDEKRKPFINNDMKNATCHRCGFNGHRQFDEKCPAKSKTCNKCGGLDHFSRKCRTKKRPRRVIEKTYQPNDEGETKINVKKEDEQPTKKKVEEVKFVDTIPDKEYIFCIDHKGERAKNELEIVVGGVKVTAVIDSASKYNIIDGRAWEHLKLNNVQVLNQRKTTDINFSSWGENPLVFGIKSKIILFNQNKINK